MADQIPTPTAADKDAAVESIVKRVDAMRNTLSEGQRNETIALVTEAVADAARGGILTPSLYRPAPRADEDASLRGTTWAAMGYSIGDVELVHDILDAARVSDPRLGGPNDKTRAIVKAARAQRALDTAESGFGAQLVPDAMYVPKIWEAAMENYGRVAPLIESRPMSGPVEKHPVMGSVPDMILAAENTAARADSIQYGTQKPGSNEVSLTAKKLLAHYNYSGELAEDSLAPLVPLLNASLAAAQAKTLDKLAVNGDLTNAGTGNINLDDADPADTLYYLHSDGIRHAALVDNTANGIDVAGAIQYSNLVKMPTLMLDRTYDHHWGRPDNPNDLVYLGSPELDNDILSLDEVVNAAAKSGQLPNMPPLRGELFRVASRYPYISTSAVELTEADGKVSTTGGNNTKGAVVCFNTKGLLWGVRRSAQIEVMRWAPTDQWVIVMTTRVALGRYSPTGAASGIEWATVAYNITNA